LVRGCRPCAAHSAASALAARRRCVARRAQHSPATAASGARRRLRQAAASSACRRAAEDSATRALRERPTGPQGAVTRCGCGGFWWAARTALACCALPRQGCAHPPACAPLAATPGGAGACPLHVAASVVEAACAAPHHSSARTCVCGACLGGSLQQGAAERGLRTASCGVRAVLGLVLPTQAAVPAPQAQVRWPGCTRPGARSAAPGAVGAPGGAGVKALGAARASQCMPVHASARRCGHAPRIVCESRDCLPGDSGRKTAAKGRHRGGTRRSAPRLCLVHARRGLRVGRLHLKHARGWTAAVRGRHWRIGTGRPHA